MIPEEKNPKVLSTEELLARFNAQKAGTLGAINKNIDPWGSELVDIDSMLDGQKEPAVPQAKPVAQEVIPENGQRQGFGKYIGKKFMSSVMGLGEMVMETPQAIEALSNAPAVMLTEAMIKRKLRKGEIDQETGSYLMKEAATITPRRTITGNMVNTDTMPGEVLAEGDLNTWFESNKEKFSNAATRYDQTATEYLKSGQFGKALGAVAGGVAESAAPTLAAMFIPGGAAALGIGVGSQSYDDVKDREDMAEGMKIADAVTTGVFEWLFERFGSREMGKALMEIYQKAGKKGVRNAFTSPGMQNLIGKAYKKFGVWFAPVHEGISEGLTTLGQNAAAIVSGEDPERDIADGFWDSVLIGAGMGGTFSLVEKAAEKHKIYREGKAGPVIEPLTVEEQDPEQIVRDLGRKYAYNGFNDQLPEQNFVKYGEMKDGRKVIIKSTNFATDPEQMLVTVVDAENPESKTEMVKGTMIVNSMDVPYEEWVANEMKNYQATKAEVNNQVAKASAPVQEGATIPIGEQLFNVTQVTPEGITLNEIDKEGNLTANTQVITPDQYGEVFGVPTEQTAPISQPETPAAQIQPEMQPQAEQPVAEQGQPATTATVSPQSRKISDGKNEFTILPQEDGNFRMSETFQTQKQAESTIKKLQELYPKLTWETEVTDSGDYFTPDTYSIVAKVSQKKAPKAPKVEPVKAKEEPAPASATIDVTKVPIPESSDNDLAEKQDYQLSSDNVTDATYDIKRGIGLEPGSMDLISGYTRIGDAIIRIKDHAPNWENFREDIEERGVKKIVNITVGNYPSPNFREHDKTAMEAIEAEYPDVEFVNIEIEDGESIAEAIKQAQQAIQQPVAEQTTVQPPSAPDETAAEEEVQKAGKVETTRAETAQVDLAKANAEVDIHPTDAQKDAGNYKKGHLNIAGLDISIENPAGTVRSGVDNSGKKWSVMMNNTYGYFRRTEGKDGDQVDVFIGDNLNAPDVYIVDQVNPETGVFDEHKTMLGFNSAEDARENYFANYEPGWKGFGSITKMSMDQFKKWLGNAKRTRKPVDPNVPTKQAEKPVEDNRPIKKLKEKKGWPMSKADEARLSREPQSFEEAVYMFFLGRGRISMNDYYTHFGKNPTERLKNIWMYSKDGIKLDKLNEVPIFEANPNLLVGMEGAMDQANAFVAAIRGVIGGINDVRTAIDKLQSVSPDDIAPIEEPEQQEDIDAGQVIVEELRPMADEDPEILRIFDVEINELGNTFDDLKAIAASDPQYFQVLPYGLNEKQFNELKNILNDTERQQQINSLVNKTGIPESSSEGDNEVPGSTESESRTPGEEAEEGRSEQPAVTTGTRSEVVPIPSRPEFAGEFFEKQNLATKEFRYKMLNRPFDIGTYPKEGFIKSENDPKGGHQILTYDRQLPAKEWSKWDFLPLTDIEQIEGKEFTDKDGDYSRISLEWMGNKKYATVSLYDKNGDLVEEPYSMSAKDILQNIESGYWIEKAAGEKSPADSGASELKSWRDAFEEAKAKNDLDGVQSLYDKVNVALNGIAQKYGEQAVAAFEQLRDDIKAYAETVKAKKPEFAGEYLEQKPSTPARPAIDPVKAQVDNLKLLIDNETSTADTERRIAELKSKTEPTKAQAKELKQWEVVFERQKERAKELYAKIDYDVISASKVSQIRKLIEETNALNKMVADRILRLQDQRDAKEKSLHKRNELFGDRKEAEEQAEGVRPMFAGEMFEASSQTLQSALKPFNESIKKAEEEIDRNNQLLDEKIDLVLSGAQMEIDMDPPAEPGEKAVTPKEAEPNTLQMEIVGVSKPSQKIEDFGELISGAKKEIRGQIKKHLDTTDDDILNNSISKVLPPIDYKQLIDSGAATREEAAFLHYFRHEIGPKPKSTYKQQRWLRGVNAYKDVLRWITDKETFKAEHKGMTFMELMNDNINDYAVQQMKEQVNLLLDLGFPEITSLKGYEIRHFEARKTLNKDRQMVDVPAVFAITKGNMIVHKFGTREEAVAGLKYILTTENEAPQKVKFDMWRERNKPGIFIGKKLAAGKFITLAQGFDKVSEAKKYIDNHQEELERMLEEKKIIPYERPEERGPRIGKDYRGGKDVTPEMFSETFGFRGVQFGNYVEQQRRQEDLNEAYDALIDLADILNIPARAISLSGQLGIAFGARGSGGKNAAAAHYEPSEIVINLTKGNGPGSLAHEWFHAVDSYFSRMRGRKMEFITDRPRPLINKEGVTDESVRPEVLEAFDGLVKAINQSKLPQRSRELDKRRSKDYWSTTIEMGARSFESYVRARLADKGVKNDYLVAFRDMVDYIIAAGGAEDAYPYPTEAELEPIGKAFDKLFQTISIKEEGERMVMFRTQRENAKSISKERQLTIIQDSNPMLDDYHTGIRSVNDIKTAEEAFREIINENGEAAPDFNASDMQKALQSGKITVYSSNPIKNGVFVTPSRMQAEAYAGKGKVYSDTVNINDVAWIDYIEGQYAKVSDDAMFRIIGEKSASTIDRLLDNLATAKKMEADYSPREVFLATGWQRGADGKWRHETRDIELKKDIDFISKLKAQNEAFTEEVPLTEVVDDEELFNSYPQLKDVKLTFYNYGSYPELTNTGAFANFTQKIIALGTKNMAQVRKGYQAVLSGNRRNNTNDEAVDLFVYDRDSLRSILSHELQHYIQRIEGFGEGGTLPARGSVGQGDSKYQYSHLVGEVEARNVQRRLGSTPEVRRQTMLSETEDVARDQQIIIRNEFDNQENRGIVPKTPQATGWNALSDLLEADELDDRVWEVKVKIKSLANQLNTPVIIVQSRNELPQSIQAQARRNGAMERDLLYGVWDPNTETAYLVMDDVLRGGPEQGLNEAVKTILHEIVGHKGLPMLLGEEAYNDLLEDIYDSIPVDDLTLIRYQYGWTEDRKLIAEEYLGMMAEDNLNPSLLQRIIAKIREYLRRFFDIEYSENDVYSLLRQSRRNLEKTPEPERGFYRSRPQPENFEYAGEYMQASEVYFRSRKAAAAKRNTTLGRAAEAYSERKAIRTGEETLQGIREYIQDLSLPVRKFEEEVLRRGGKQDNTSKPYRDMSLSFGRQEKLYKDYFEGKMKPVLQAVAEIKRAGMPGEEVLPYLIAKHAMERNPAFRSRELKEWVESHKENVPPEEVKAKFDELKDKDYSGVMGFDTEGAYTNPDQLAADIVAEFESQVDKNLIDNLWDKINAATSAILDTWEKGNQISPDQKQEYLSQFRYFVPLRGWREGAAKDLVYTKGEGFSRSLQHAQGRKSLAENPLAYLLNVQFQAIAEQVDNEVKTSMLNLIIKNLANNEIHELATIKKLYYIRVTLPDGTEEWEPTISRPPQEMFDNGNAKLKVHNEHERLRKPRQAREHEVIVRKPGGDMVMVFNNRQLTTAQAMNKQNYMYRTVFGNIYDARDLNKVMALMGHMNNMLKSLYTSWNIVFPFTNFIRDFQEASITQSIKSRTGGKVIKNYRGAFPAVMRRIQGKQDMNNPMDQALEDFYNYGGATGYTHMKSPEDIEQDINKEVARMVRKGTAIGVIGDAGHALFNAVEHWNKIFEDATRFSVYLSSLAIGNSKEDAAIDAKEASVNFNRKGKGSKAWDAWFAFFNVAVQSMQKNFKLAKDYPKRFTQVAFSFVMLGFLEALMNAITDDDDDPDSSYYNLNSYMRQNYLVIPNLPRLITKGAKGDKYLSIPLPQFWRGFKSMGAIGFDVATGRMKAGQAVKDAIGNFMGGLLPIDVAGFWRTGEFSLKSVAASLAPTITRPVLEVAFNQNYMGYTIRKEPFTKEQEKYLADAGLGKDNVNPAAKFFTDLLFRWGGGDSRYKYYTDKKGRTRKVWADINPSNLEHIFKGYTGGTGGVVSDLITTVSQVLDPAEEVDFRNVPFVNRFVRNTPEAKWAIIRDYYDLKSENDRDVTLMKEYERQARQTGDISQYARMSTDEFRARRQQLFDSYEDQIKNLTKGQTKDDMETASMAIELMDRCVGQVKELEASYKRK